MTNEKPNPSAADLAFDPRALTAALLVLAQSNFDLIAAQTQESKQDAFKRFQDMYNKTHDF
jgi:hypothetical protein